MIFNYGFNQDWVKLFEAYSLLILLLLSLPLASSLLPLVHYCKASLWPQLSMLLWSQVPACHLLGDNTDQLRVSACPAWRLSSWRKTAADGLSAMPILQRPSAPSHVACVCWSRVFTPLLWPGETIWQLEEAFTGTRQVIRSRERLLPLANTSKQICVCIHGRGTYRATHTAQPCICALVPSSWCPRILLYHSSLPHL